MRNPRRARNLALLYVLLGALGIAIPYVLFGAPKKDTIWGAVAVAGATVAFLGFCYLVYTQVEVWRFNRLIGGDGVRRWTIQPAVWRAFVELNDRLNADDPENKFVINDAQRACAEPVDVLISSKSVLIGDDFHSLPVGGFNVITGPHWIDGPPACIAYHFVNYGGDTVSGGSWSVRVPVAPGAEQDAISMFEQQQARLPQPVAGPTAKNLRLRRNVALVVGAISALAFVVAMSMAKTSRGSGQIVILVTAITGALLAPAALLCAGVWHFWARDQSQT